MRFGFWRAGVFALVFALGGCGGFGNIADDSAGLDNSARVSFKVRGFMIIAPAGQSKRRLGFVWRRMVNDDAVDIITVRNAAGIVQARMRIDDNGAQLATASAKTAAANAETLTKRAFGISLPLRLVGDFLGGGGDNAQVRYHLQKKMRQLGWRARFEARDAAGLPLRFGADGGGGSVDIVITRR